MPLKPASRLFLSVVGIAGTPWGTLCAVEPVDFTKEIKSILEAACVGCHGPDKQKGKLRLDTKEAWLKGGDNGAVFTPHAPEKSDVMHRIALAEDEDDVMPPKGKGDRLTAAQIDLVKRWIAEGGEWPDGVIAFAVPAKGTKADDPAALIGPPASPAELSTIAKLAQRGIKVLPLATGVNWRRADLRSVAEKVSPADLSELAHLPSIQELNLSGVRVRDQDFATFAALKNLSVLHLENTPIGDPSIPTVGAMEKLTYLNLFGTAVSDVGLQHLAGLKRLKSLYLAGTKVTAQGVADLKQQLPQTQIEFGADFAEIMKKDPEPPKKPAATPSPAVAPVAPPATPATKPAAEKP